jgi:hypothetical protein
VAHVLNYNEEEDGPVQFIVTEELTGPTLED